MSTRREFLQKMSLLTLGGLVAGSTKTFGAVSEILSPATPPAKQLGLQIYSLQRELYTGDTAANMKALREMGYVNLELAGYNATNSQIGGMDMMEFKRMADDAGLKIVSSHVGLSVPNPNQQQGQRGALPYVREMLAPASEYWKKVADDHAKLGCKYVIQPSMPIVNNHDDASMACEFFNLAGRVTKEAGLQWGYHNHDREFQRLVRGGETPQPNSRRAQGDVIQDLFIAGTDPSLVMFELDVYWTVRGASDPLDYMINFPDRIKALHIKDTKVLGQSGLLNFENIFNRMYAMGVNDWYVELEGVGGGITQTEGVKQCADYLLRSSFVK